MIIGTIGIQQWGAKHITGAAASYVLHWSSIWEWKGSSQKHGHWIKKVSRFHCETNAYFEPDSLQPDPASRRGSGLQAVDGWTQRRLPLGGAQGPGIKTPIVPSFIPPFGKKKPQNIPEMQKLKTVGQNSGVLYTFVGLEDLAKNSWKCSRCPQWWCQSRWGQQLQENVCKILCNTTNFI